MNTSAAIDQFRRWYIAGTSTDTQDMYWIPTYARRKTYKRVFTPIPPKPDHCWNCKSVCRIEHLVPHPCPLWEAKK